MAEFELRTPGDGSYRCARTVALVIKNCLENRGTEDGILRSPQRKSCALFPLV